MDDIITKANTIKSWLIDIRRDFHQNPELGMEEFRTAQKICDYLEEMNIQFISGVANTGVVGIIKGKYPGPTIGLRADMDALPIFETNNVSYKSLIDGKMHACGHDAHMAIQLGTAKILSEMRENLYGNIKLIFQPAEENIGGAYPMIKEGVLENPHVDAIFGLHMATEIETGKIGIRYGRMNASSDTIEINIYGKSAHGAYPELGIDAIVVATNIINAIQTIVSRNTSSSESVVITIGKISGGVQGNILCDKVTMLGTIRALDEDIRAKTIRRIEEIVDNVSKSFGAKGEIIKIKRYIGLVNSNEVVDIVKESVIDILGYNSVVNINKPRMGAEDFAYFADARPSAFFRIGCKNIEKGIIYGGHTPTFDIDEDALPIGVAIQVCNVLKTIKYYQKIITNLDTYEYYI
jgi:amidohydrolase